MKIKLIPAAAAIVGIFLSIWMFYLTQFHEPEKKYEIPPSISPFPSSIIAAGIVESADENISIGTPTAGVVDQVYVSVSEQVKKGDPLFSLDTRDLQAKLQVQKTNVEVAKAKLNRALDQVERYKNVKDRRAVSVEELKSKEFELEIIKQELKVAKATEEETAVLIDRLTIRAPKDGYVLQKNIHAGEYVNTDSKTPAIILGNLQHLQVRADVDEYNAYRISSKSPAVAFPKNNASVKIPLIFSHIEPYIIPKKSLTGGADERIDTRVLQIIYEFDKPDDQNIYIGQQLDVYIQVEKLKLEKE